MYASFAKKICLLAITFLLCLTVSTDLIACPFCNAPSLTLTEQIAEADAVVLVEWVSSKKGEGDSAGSTLYRVKDVHKAPNQKVSAGDTITLARHRLGKKGDLYLLLGSVGVELEWNSPMEVTTTSYAYLTKAPATDVETSKRLIYFMKYLENPDRLIADDAFYEFANAPYKDIKQVADKIPHDKVKTWITSSKTPVTRLGLYGLLLGLSGDKDDAATMKKIIVKQQDSLRLGIDGIMSGYILLTGVEGLEFLEESKLKNIFLTDQSGKVLLDETGDKKRVPFSEVFATMQALRFMWTYGDGQIEKDRLRQSLRILLNRPELADLVVADLARWKDWSVQDKLMKLYFTEDYDVRSIKTSIVRYYLACSVDMPKDSKLPEPAHVTKAKKHLKTLEEKDPKIVKAAKRYFFIR